MQQVGEKSFRHKYILREKLGQGSYSQVYAATNILTNKKVAVKITKIIKGNDSTNASVRREIEVLKGLQHPNIVQLIEWFDDRETSTLYAVIELLEGGELFERIIQKTVFNEKDARDLVFILLSAVKYMHDNGIVHRYSLSSKTFNN